MTFKDLQVDIQYIPCSTAFFIAYLVENSKATRLRETASQDSLCFNCSALYLGASSTPVMCATKKA